MSVRARSWIGAGGVAVGVLLMVVALLSAKVVAGVPTYPAGVLWIGIALAVSGVGMILWALFGALRQIETSGAHLEARLRVEVDAHREQKRPL